MDGIYFALIFIKIIYYFIRAMIGTREMFMAFVVFSMLHFIWATISASACTPALLPSPGLSSGRHSDIP
jgi:hypothetical protein